MAVDRKCFLLSDPEDVDTLPTVLKDGTDEKVSGRCAPGSVAYTPDLKYMAILGNDSKWHEVLDDKLHILYALFD